MPVMGFPIKRTTPSLGLVNPDTRLRTVDFPQPLGPTMVINSPSETVRFVSDSAVTMRSRAQKRFAPPSISRTGSLISVLTSRGFSAAVTMLLLGKVLIGDDRCP